MKWSIRDRHARISDDNRWVLRRCGNQWDIFDRSTRTLPYRGTRRTLTAAKAAADWFAESIETSSPPPEESTSLKYVVRLRTAEGYCFVDGRGAEIVAKCCGLALVDGTLPLALFPADKLPEYQAKLERAGYRVGDADRSYRVTAHSGKPGIIPTDGDSGFKGRAARLVEALNGKWTHRSRCYTLCSLARLELFEAMYSTGWDGAVFGGLETPSGEEWPGNGEYNGYSRTVAKVPRLADVAEIA
jgi:hypothetical protein